MSNFRRLAATLAVALSSIAPLFLSSGTAQAVSPASFTTDSTGSAVNKNHYTNKCDVYLNGGPTGAALPAGSYVFFVLAPGGQADPNGPKKLSNDSNAARTFTSDGSDVTYGGAHPTSTDSVTGHTLINLCDPALASQGYNDTPNPGGVYILAICQAGNQTPSGCKYDAFKVVGANQQRGGTDLVATKTAVGSFRRTFRWNVEKSVDKTRVQTNANTATFNYTVVATKDAGTDSNFKVTGQIQVFNPNDNNVTGVAVTDAIGLTNCTVGGGSTTIAAGGNTTFTYTCSLPGANQTTTGTNVATITWDKSSVNSPNDSATAQAPFDFTAAPTLVHNCTTVTDTLGSTTTTLGTVCATHTFTYSRNLAVPQVGCTVFTNTARESASGTSDSVSVTVCRTNVGGHTIGFWQNKNGQAKVANAATTGSPTLCTFLQGYPNVLSGFPSPCNSTTLPPYVSNVVQSATCSGDCTTMYRAQFLGTALSVYFTPALGTTGVITPASITGDSCMTVNQLLSFGNTNFNTLKLDKSKLVAIKDIYDNINNNNQVTCAP
jgi:hypothetical protein